MRVREREIWRRKKRERRKDHKTSIWCEGTGREEKWWDHGLKRWRKEKTCFLLFFLPPIVSQSERERMEKMRKGKREEKKNREEKIERRKLERSKQEITVIRGEKKPIFLFFLSLQFLFLSFSSTFFSHFSSHFLPIFLSFFSHFCSHFSCSIKGSRHGTQGEKKRNWGKKLWKKREREGKIKK